MSNDDRQEKIAYHVARAAGLIATLSDDDVKAVVSGEALDALVRALTPPRKISGEKSIYEHLLSAKNRYTFMARLRNYATQSSCIEGKVEGRKCFVSPSHIQWHDGGIMFTQGENRFSGLIGLFIDGEVKFGVVARDIGREESQIGPNDIAFVGWEEAKKREAAAPRSLGDLREAVLQLEGFLARRCEDETVYQSFFERHPWVFGAQYKAITPHARLDDRNIPDFTAVRVHDGARDVIEIKQPFVTVHSESRGLLSAFNDAWNQCERYLDFAVQQADYLHREKGLRFDNPSCWLVIGFDLSGEAMREMRRKERMNPRIRVLNYNDVIAMAKGTIEFLKQLRKKEEENTNELVEPTS